MRKVIVGIVVALLLGQAVADVFMGLTLRETNKKLDNINGRLAAIEKPAGKEKPAMDHPPAPTSVAAASGEADGITDEMIKQGNIGGAQGYAHPFARAIMADPKAWGFTGDLADAKAVKKWVGDEAYRNEIDFGIVDKLGAELRVNEPNAVAAILMKDKDGTRHLRLLRLDKDGHLSKSKNSQVVRTLAPGQKPLGFMGRPGHEKLLAWEYIEYIGSNNT